MNAAFRTEGSTTTQRALFITSCGISSGISRTSWMTVPAFCILSSSFVSSGFGPAAAKGARLSTPITAVFQRFIESSSFQFFMVLGDRHQHIDPADSCPPGIGGSATVCFCPFLTSNGLRPPGSEPGRPVTFLLSSIFNPPGLDGRASLNVPCAGFLRLSMVRCISTCWYQNYSPTQFLLGLSFSFRVNPVCSVALRCAFMKLSVRGPSVCGAPGWVGAELCGGIHELGSNRRQVDAVLGQGQGEVGQINR